MNDNSIEVKKKLLNQIEQYLNNEITRMDFGRIAESYYTKNAHLIKDTDFYNIYSAVIPDLCLIYIDEPGQEDEKENCFRDGIEQVFKSLKELSN